MPPNTGWAAVKCRGSKAASRATSRAWILTAGSLGIARGAWALRGRRLAWRTQPLRTAGGLLLRGVTTGSGRATCKYLVAPSVFCCRSFDRLAFRARSPSGTSVPWQPDDANVLLSGALLRHCRVHGPRRSLFPRLSHGLGWCRRRSIDVPVDQFPDLLRLSVNLRLEPFPISRRWRLEPCNTRRTARISCIWKRPCACANSNDWVVANHMTPSLSCNIPRTALPPKPSSTLRYVRDFPS